MLITPVIFGVSGILMGILNSYQHFVLPALAPVLYNAAIIGGAVFLAPSMGVYGLAAGVVAGAFLHLLSQVPFSFGLGCAMCPIWGSTMRTSVTSDVAAAANHWSSQCASQSLGKYDPCLRTAGGKYRRGSRMLFASCCFRMASWAFACTAAFPTFSEQVARQQSTNSARRSPESGASRCF